MVFVFVCGDDEENVGFSFCLAFDEDEFEAEEDGMGSEDEAGLGAAQGNVTTSNTSQMSEAWDNWTYQFHTKCCMISWMIADARTMTLELVQQPLKLKKLQEE